MNLKEKGITLIALVITIIILLILAGITISIIINNGILEKSQTAVDSFKYQQAREKLELAILDYKISKMTGENRTFPEIILEMGGTAEYDEEKEQYDVNIDGYDFEVEIPKAKEYTITLTKGEGIDTVIGNGKVEEGKSISISAISEEGYEFNKWKITDGEGTIADEESAETTVIPISDIIIEATAKIKLATPKIVDGNNINEDAENGTLTGGNYAYNNPVIPAGFKVINTSYTVENGTTTTTVEASWISSDGKTIDNWNNGLVIQDKIGNEFVWIPAYVKKGTDGDYSEYEDNEVPQYKKWCTVVIGYNNSNVQDGNIPEKVTNEEQWNQSEKSQIEKYEGFYIARYEAGTKLEYSSRNIDITEELPLSKRNEVPWNNISYSNAKKRAESMYNSEYVQSGLVTGTMWDTVMRWIEDEESGATTNSISWGNYYNAPVKEITEYSTDSGKTWKPVDSSDITKTTTKGTNTYWLLKTGHSNYTKRKNIYDLAGNLWEWTSEIYKPSYNMVRGGVYSDSGSYNSGASRNYAMNSGGNGNYTFRVGLFIQ